MAVFNVYFADREFAREHGDPLLGQVEAETREGALEKAHRDAGVRSRMVAGAGLWVIEAEREERNRRLFRDGRRGR